MTTAGEAWKKFGKVLRPELEQDPTLQQLARMILEGNYERFLILMPLLYARITRFVQSLPKEAITFWYDDPVLATRYSGAQQAVVPVRTDIGEHMANIAWQAIERVLATRQIAYVLDLGTGDGIMARTFLTHRPAHIPRERVVVLAGDRSAAMLATHAQRFAEYNIRTLDAVHGDMRAASWQEITTYRPLVDADFNGFDVVTGMMCFHILPDRGTHLYPGLARILRSDGTLIFSHDFFRKGDSWSSYAPSHTLVDGYRAYAQTTDHPISFVSYLAGFMLRRGILQGDQLCELNGEIDNVARSFPYVRAECHRRYNEFAVVTASQQNLTSTAPHGAFVQDSMEE